MVARLRYLLAPGEPARPREVVIVEAIIHSIYKRVHGLDARYGCGNDDREGIDGVPKQMVVYRGLRRIVMAQH